MSTVKHQGRKEVNSLALKNTREKSNTIKSWHIIFLLNQGCVNSLCLLSGLQCSSKLIMKPIVKAELLGLPTGDAFSKCPYSSQWLWNAIWTDRFFVCLSIYGSFRLYNLKLACHIADECFLGSQYDTELFSRHNRCQLVISSVVALA